MKNCDNVPRESWIWRERQRESKLKLHVNSSDDNELRQCERRTINKYPTFNFRWGLSWVLLIKNRIKNGKCEKWKYYTKRQREKLSMICLYAFRNISVIQNNENVVMWKCLFQNKTTLMSRNEKILHHIAYRAWRCFDI